MNGRNSNKSLHRTQRVCHAVCGGEGLQASRALTVSAAELSR